MNIALPSIVGDVIWVALIGGVLLYMMRRGMLSRFAALRPPKGADACDANTLSSRILTLDDSGQPFQYTSQEDGIITAKWFVAASRKGLFIFHQKAARYNLLLVLSPEHQELRVFEQLEGDFSGTRSFSVMRPRRYNTGFPGLGTLLLQAWTRNPPIPDPPPVPDNPTEAAAGPDFDGRRLRDPLIQTVLACGWTWVPVFLREHLDVERPLA